VSDFEQIRAILPAWIGWARPLVLVVFAFVSTALAARVAAWAALPKRNTFEGAHWTERAHRIYPARYVAGFTPFIAAGLFGGLAAYESGPLLVPPLFLVVGAVVIAAFVGGIWGAASLVRRAMGRPHTALVAARETAFTMLVVGAHWLVAIVMMWIIGPEIDVVGVLGVVGGVVGFVLCARAGGFRLARLLGAARPASPRVERLVLEAADRVGVQPSGVYELDIPMANAFACPITREVVFTISAIEAMNDDEIVAIACHEIGHLSAPTRIKWSRLVHMFAVFPLGLARPAIAAMGPLGIVALYAPVVLASLFASKTLRKSEERADGVAHDHIEDRKAYTTALAKLHEANLTPAVMGSSRRQVHPNLYDRLVAAGHPPDYVRPEPPNKWRMIAGAVVMAVLLLLSQTLLQASPVLAKKTSDDREAAEIARVALSGGDRASLFRLANLRAHDDRWHEARWLISGARSLAPNHHETIALDARIATMTDRCAYARSAIADAIDASDPNHVEECGWIDDAKRSYEARCVFAGACAGGCGF